MRKTVTGILSTLILICLSFSAAGGASNPRWGRVSFFGQAAQTSYALGKSSFSEMVAALTYRAPLQEGGGFEYAVDFRVAGFPSSEDRSQRLSLYEAYVGYRTRGGWLTLRAGQMWLNELGALGSLGGAQAETKILEESMLGELKLGVFGGLEPKILELGYVGGVKKFGAYLTLDNQKARRHVLGYVNIQNQGLTERSVVVFSNFIPVKDKFYLYQDAQYDLSGPGGEGSGKFSYFFTNVRYKPWRLLELQGAYQYGRSIDARTITEDLINGRPIDEEALAGFFFESIGGRLTFRLPPGFYVFGGYAEERINQGDERRTRVSLGFFSANLLKTGLDLRISDSRISTGDGFSYDSWNFSLGRNLGPKIYLEGFYSSSVSFFRFGNGDGLVLENRPRTKRYGISSILSFFRTFSVQLTVEGLDDDFSTEARILAGLIYRF